MKTAVLTSRDNPLLKEIRRAVARGGLGEGGWCVAESFHLLDEALRSGVDIHAVVAAEHSAAKVKRALENRGGARLSIVPNAVFDQLAATESSQGVMTLVVAPSWNREDFFGAAPLVVVLDGIQDPGNAGAILRAAEAFGASGAIAVKATVNLHNPKSVRASAGSVFRLPLMQDSDPFETRELLAMRALTVFSAMPSEGAAPWEVDLTTPAAIVVGGEARGVSPLLRTAAIPVRIPTQNVESLNAAMSAGLLLYEARRQRLTEGRP